MWYLAKLDRKALCVKHTYQKVKLTLPFSWNIFTLKHNVDNASLVTENVKKNKFPPKLIIFMFFMNP